MNGNGAGDALVSVTRRSMTTAKTSSPKIPRKAIPSSVENLLPVEYAFSMKLSFVS